MQSKKWLNLSEKAGFQVNQPGGLPDKGLDYLHAAHNFAG